MNLRKAPTTLILLATIVLPCFAAPNRTLAAEGFHDEPMPEVLQPAEEASIITAHPNTQSGQLQFTLPAGSSRYSLISGTSTFQLSETAGDVAAAQGMSKSITFKVAPNLTPGNYEQEVDVVADQKLVQRFVLKVTVPSQTVAAQP
jgi:hypothetical protein